MKTNNIEKECYENDEEFGMGSVKDVKRHVPNKVEEGECENEVIIK